MSQKTNVQEYTPRATGAPLTRDFRIYLSLGDRIISPWHDIPLFADERKGILNMVVEVPRWENVKLEVALPSLYLSTTVYRWPGSNLGLI